MLASMTLSLVFLTPYPLRQTTLQFSTCGEQFDVRHILASMTPVLVGLTPHPFRQTTLQFSTCGEQFDVRHMLASMTPNSRPLDAISVSANATINSAPAMSNLRTKYRTQ
jgi:hypothetical protein